MYEYKFVQVELKKGLMKNTPKEDYHEIIREEAKNGWRLVQIFAPSVVGYGTAENFELIFEKEIK